MFRVKLARVAQAIHGVMIHAKRMASKKVENRRIGQIGESIAITFLESKGFSIVRRNYKFKFGEVDIVAKKGKTIHFVEVKSARNIDSSSVSRENTGYRPEELVHPMKLQKISRVAEVYMGNQPKDLDCQIDVVAVFIDEVRRVGRCRFIENVS